MEQYWTMDLQKPEILRTIEKAMWNMLFDIANGERALPALRTFLESDLHKAEVTEFDKHCLFPDSSMIDEENAGTEPTTTAATSLPLFDLLPYSTLQVADQLTAVSGQQSPPTEFYSDMSFSELLELAPCFDNWPEPHTGAEQTTTVPVHHNVEPYIFPEFDWMAEVTEGACF